MKYYESSTQELKECYTTDLKKEIVAFANTNGGNIYIGIKDNGEIIGIDNINKVMESISSMIHDAIKPDLTMLTSITKIIENNLEIICINVARGINKPYYLTEKGLKPSGVYIRNGITSVPSTEEMIKKMIMESANYSFENEKSVKQDLTFEYSKVFFEKRKIILNDEAMIRLGIKNKDGEYSNLGYILSDQSPYVVKVATFQDNSVLEFKTRKEFEGSILKIAEEVFDYLDLINMKNTKIKGLIREDSFDYPIYALRESLLNALIHRDYSYKGGIIINVHPNRIETISLGGIISGLTIDDIKRGISETRNPKLANICYRLDLIEAYGTGINRINESYSDFYKKPEIIVTNNTFSIVLYNKNVNNTIITEKQQILDYIKNNGSITRSEVEKILGMKKTSALNLLNELIEDKIIFLNGDSKKARYYLK